MRNLWMILVTAGTAGLLLAGCGQGQESADTGGRAAVENQAAAGDQAEAPESATPETGGRMLEAPEGTELASVTLEGTIGCGHCTYHVTPECALATQTAEGVVYVIEGDPEHEAHMGERFSGKPITVTGRVAQTDSMNVVYAEKVELH
jgi:hypothetical protein